MFRNRTIVIATMHGKETIIGPLLESSLEARPIVCKDLNTDVFGTFTRETPRMGTQVEAARIKALKALELTGETAAISNEGSFGPHSAIPFFTCNIELVLLIDQKNDLEIVGQAISTETNFNHCTVTNIEETLHFAERYHFPGHGLVVIYQSKKQREIIKGIPCEKKLKEALNIAFNQTVDGEIHLETDMRAHYNPTRMKVIQQATLNLLEKIKNLCPSCEMPGYSIVEYLPGLPCSWCGFATQSPMTVIFRCTKCKFEQSQRADGPDNADPGECLMCNP